MSEPIQTILEHLNNKAVLKQKVYSKTLEVFNQMRVSCAELLSNLNPKVDSSPYDIEIMVQEYGMFEFHLKFSGDTIVFLMHTNVFTFPPNHLISKSKYVREQPALGYFGMIQIYNFLSDSIKYNRQGDEGYQLARIFINADGNFYTEGKRKLGFIFGDLPNQVADSKSLEMIIEQCMIYCLDFDLYVPPINTFETISVQQKNYFNNSSGITTGKRLGFKVIDQSRHTLT